MDYSQFSVIIINLERWTERAQKTDESAEKKYFQAPNYFRFLKFLCIVFQYIGRQMRNMDKNQKQQKKSSVFIDAFIDCESVIIRPENNRKGGEG